MEVDLRCSLTPDSLKLRLHIEVSVGFGGTVVFCKLVQRGLGGRVRLTAVCRPQELWSERGALRGAAVAQLDDMRDGEEADHIHQQLESKSCEQTRVQTMFYFN